MEFNSPTHVYNCIPPVLGNDTAAEPVEIGLQVVNMPEQDAEVMAQRGLAPEAVSARQTELVKSKVKYIRGLVVDGQTVSDWDTFYKLAPRELVGWVLMAIYSTVTLSAAERKN